MGYEPPRHSGQRVRFHQNFLKDTDLWNSPRIWPIGQIWNKAIVDSDQPEYRSQNIVRRVSKILIKKNFQLIRCKYGVIPR